MSKRWRRLLLLSALGAGLVLGLAGCMELFTGAGTPTLILGEVRLFEGRGEILLSVRDMPDGGLASVAVQITGITYTDKVDNVRVEGLNGFEVLAQQFDPSPGSGGFFVAHPCAGLPAGEFAKLVFDVTGTVTLDEFTVDKNDIAMGDDSNMAITFVMDEAYHYYAK